MSKVMTVRHVVRFKGTILVGKLECDIKVNDEIKVGDHPARIFGIESFWSLLESAPAGEEVAIMIRNISEVPVEPGWEVTKE